MSNNPNVDIFDDRYNYIGIASKKNAHEKGLWHRTFSCLVVDPQRGVVHLQKKHFNQYSFDRPDYVEAVTAGGHYEAGESIEDGIRELHEELNLKNITYSDLYSLGIRQTSVTITPQYIEREFQHLHLLPLKISLHEYTLGNTEVSGLVEITIEDGILLVTAKVAEIPANFLHWPEGATVADIFSGTLRKTDLIPGYLATDRLYLRMFIAAQRIVAGQCEYLLW
jgi:isopentenyldiphosphate isomerase